MTPPNERSLNHHLPTCALAIHDETLSALRDGMLDTHETTRLRAHIAGCAACQRRLAQFDATSNLLRNQRELEPGDRILMGVRAHAEQLAMQSQRSHWLARQQTSGENLQEATSRRSIMSMNNDETTQPLRRLRAIPQTRSRRIWGSLGAVAAIAAITLLFVAIFHGLGAFTPRTGSTSAASTATANGFPTKPPVATATPGTPQPTTTQSPTVDAQTAWGNSAIVATVDTRIDSTHVFEASNVTYDESGLLGYEVTLTSAGSVDTSTPIQAGILSIASKQFTPIGLSGPANYQIHCCQDDGHFLVASYNSAPGTTCGVCNTSLWVYDRQTGKIRQVANGSDFGGGGILGEYTDHGLLVINFTGQVIVADLAAGTSGPLSGTSSGYYYTLLTYSWPDVVYAQQQKTQNAPSSVHIYDMATGQDTESSALTQIYTVSQNNPTNPTASFDSMIIAGTTAYCTTDNTQGGLPTLYEIDQFTQSGAHARILANPIASELVAANDRLIIFPPGAWDLAQHRFVNGPVINTGAGPYAGDSFPLNLSGHYLIFIRPTGSISGGDLTNLSFEQVTIYDTSQLPV